MTSAAIEQQLRSSLDRHGFTFMQAADMKQLCGDLTADTDWLPFKASWDDLREDTYLAANGRCRRRRHAVFSVDRGGRILRKADQPHYQSVEYNPLQGGVERWFEPIRPDIGNNPVLRRLLIVSANVFSSANADTPAWHVEAHQFRIEARPGQPGLPTPEGVHRDGVDFVLVVMIGRHNISSGTTSIHAHDGARLGEFTLSNALDAAWVVDERVLHGVTPVHAIVPAQPAWRDVLVITYRSRNSA